MKTLYILRHAKSSWDDATLSDFERPLNSRGLKAAPFMGNLMKERGLTPDVILSSPATRARQTAELVCEAASFASEIEFDPKIYDATVGTLSSVISEITDDSQFAMIVGHNPGAEGLIFYLTGQVTPMPTAALAVVELDIKSWGDIRSDCGKLENILRPKDEM